MAVYKKAMTDREQLQAERCRFATMLANLIRVREDRVICFDETTFNSYSVRERSWSKRGEPNNHARASKYISRTVYGAIGLPLGR